MATLLALATYGFVLGWSVAWPPGPINAEIMRRGLAQGFWPGYSVGLGAASGDAAWAIAVVLGEGLLLAAPQAHQALAFLSTALLAVLAAIYLHGAWQGALAWRADRIAALPERLGGGGAGYALGLGLALSSPWNIAFWLAVIGRPETLQAGPVGALVVAAAVLLATNLWVLLLTSAVVLLRWRFQSALWQVVAKGATGLLMLAFAIDGVRRLAPG
jgi:threonine/homoserine/homoserine lactone efflux protein